MFPEAAACQVLVPSESKQRLCRRETQGVSATAVLREKKASVCVCCVEGDNRVIGKLLGSELSFNFKTLSYF